MFDLPILTAEAHSSSRRRLTFATRATYGLLLLGFFWIFHRNHEDWSAGRLIPNTELAQFAAAAFEWLAVGQAMIVMALLPASVAGSVAEERSRHTLDSLLASRLSSAAIILDKLAAKMLQIGVFLAVGLPIACLLGLLGGIDPRSIAWAYGGTVSTAFFLTALSLLVSVYARKPRGAILLAYLIDAVWLLGPWIAENAMAMGARRWFGPLALVNDWVLPATPLSLVSPATSLGWAGGGPIPWLIGTLRMGAPAALTPGWIGPAALTAPLVRMIGRQLAIGAVLIIWASWRLRPVARELADGPRRRRALPWVRGRLRVRPPRRDDPMLWVLWKERYFREGGPTRVVLGFGMLIFGLLTLTGYGDAFIRTYRPALDEFFEYGYALGRNGSGIRERAFFLHKLAEYSVLFYVALLLAVAVKAAAGVTGEREGRTWDGLLATPLEPAEIVRGKVLGALTGHRTLLFLVLAPWLFGLALGALHPIGLLVAMTGLAVFLYFTSALGTLFSLRSRTSGQALIRTLGVLLILNFGTMVAGVLLAGKPQLGALLGSTIILLHELPISTLEMQRIVAHPARFSIYGGILSVYVSAYAALAWILCRAAIRGFDAVAGRALVCAGPPPGEPAPSECQPKVQRVRRSLR
jgi:ABC-type transport system involved in multi-copper enzyme maturation permease subunit